MVRLIARQSADISSIVDDLLTITRVEAGTMSIHPKAVDAPEHLARIVETLDPAEDTAGGLDRQCPRVGGSRSGSAR